MPGGRCICGWPDRAGVVGVAEPEFSPSPSICAKGGGSGGDALSLFACCCSAISAAIASGDSAGLCCCWAAVWVGVGVVVKLGKVTVPAAELYVGVADTAL